MDAGTFSMSLSVKDLDASLAFYRLIGFEPVEGCGGSDAKWLMLKRGDTLIGLFEGMFEGDVLTFNPPDARAVEAHLRAHGVEIGTPAQGAAGPCHVIVKDPDGRVVMFDQF